MSDLLIYSDGAARGNPGLSGAGAVLLNTDGSTVAKVCKYLGDDLTNNQAEYRALILALKEALALKATSIKVFADSELMVKQINKIYRVKNDGIKSLYEEVAALLKKFNRYSIEYIPREKNKRADKLANLAIDGQVL